MIALKKKELFPQFSVILGQLCQCRTAEKMNYPGTDAREIPANEEM
jgi:hypothetical protein